METKRQQKINRLIQKELGEIFLLDTKRMPGIIISVSAVKVSPDLGLARAYLSIFPSSRSGELMDNIKANVKAIRFDLGKRIGKQLRVVPEIAFFIDDSLDYLENIDRLLQTDKDKTEDKD